MKKLVYFLKYLFKNYKVNLILKKSLLKFTYKNQIMLRLKMF